MAFNNAHFSFKPGYQGSSWSGITMYCWMINWNGQVVIRNYEGVTLLRKDFVVRYICLCSAVTEFNNNKIMFGNQVGIW